jgi:hypothetical protein
MKGALIALFIGLAILVLLYFGMKIYSSNGTIDIHLHDTYLVLSYASVIVTILLFLGTFFSVRGIITTYFRSKLFLVLAVLFLAMDTYYIVTFYKLFNGTQAKSFPKE